MKTDKIQFLSLGKSQSYMDRKKRNISSPKESVVKSLIEEEMLEMNLEMEFTSQTDRAEEEELKRHRADGHI